MNVTNLCDDCIHAMVRRSKRVSIFGADECIRIPGTEEYDCPKMRCWVEGATLDWCKYRQTEEK